MHIEDGGEVLEVLGYRAKVDTDSMTGEAKTYKLNWPPAGYTVKLWCHCLPDEYGLACQPEPFICTANTQLSARRGAFSQWWPGNISQAALLGGTFEPDISGRFTIFLAPVQTVESVGLTTMQAGFMEDRQKEAALRGMTEGNALPSGTLRLSHVAHEQVGSSPKAFLLAGRAFMRFLLLPEWKAELLQDRSRYAVTPY